LKESCGKQPANFVVKREQKKLRERLSGPCWQRPC
jgi:hypothetical protein